MTSRSLTALGGVGCCHGGEPLGESLSLARPGHVQRARGKPGVRCQCGGFVVCSVTRLRGGFGGLTQIRARGRVGGEAGG